MTIEPVCRLLIDNATEVPVSRYFKDDDAVVIIKNAGPQKPRDDFAGLQRCFNDPHRLEGPAIIARTSERVMHELPIVRAEFST